MTPNTNTAPVAVRSAAIVTVLAGIWLFASPWVYGASTSPNAWNSWIVGALMLIFGLTEAGSRQMAGMNWMNMILAIWTFISPWMYGYTADTGRFINSLCVGVIVFLVGMVSLGAVSRGPHMTQQSR